MPRANRYFHPGHVWHITHRCRKKEFLLKFAKDRKRWLHWLFEARKRFGLCVLNYIITSNHIHLLVRDRGQGEIKNSMQLVLGMAARHRSIVEEHDAYGLKESVMPYATHLACEMDILNAENTLLLE